MLLSDKIISDSIYTTILFLSEVSKAEEKNLFNATRKLVIGLHEREKQELLDMVLSASLFTGDIPAGLTNVDPRLSVAHSQSALANVTCAGTDENTTRSPWPYTNDQMPSRGHVAPFYKSALSEEVGEEKDRGIARRFNHSAVLRNVIYDILKDTEC